MTGLLIYFVIGSILACIQLCGADYLHELGIMDDEEYLIHKYKRPFVFSLITVFWLPTIIWSIKEWEE